MTKKAALAMSGGVDSTVSAYLLREQGYEVAGFTMDTGNKATVAQAALAAASCGIAHYVVDLQQLFQKQVIDYFTSSYRCGQTPTPCVFCNRYLKFGALRQYAHNLGYDFFATGHYARILQRGGRFFLGRAADYTKDQSYMLFYLTEKILSSLLFPLGEYTKTEVREIAARLGLAVAETKDSQDLCFITDGDYRGFLQERGMEFCPGDFVDASGNVLGRHQGLCCYTIGQRKGLGIAAGYPVYVTKLDAAGNRVFLGREKDLFSDSFFCGNNNFITGPLPSSSSRVQVKIRYKSPAVPATLNFLPDGRWQALLDRPQKAVSPGQAAVFYQDDIVLGGGIIL